MQIKLAELQTWTILKPLSKKEASDNRERVCVKCLKLFNSKEDAMKHVKENEGHHIAYNESKKEAVGQGGDKILPKYIPGGNFRKENVEKHRKERLNLCSVEGCENKADSVVDDKRYCYTHSWGKDPKNMKEANIMDTKCEECGEPLGPEAFLSKYPVCGKCTKKRHEKAVGKNASEQPCGSCGSETILDHEDKNKKYYKCEKCHNSFPVKKHIPVWEYKKKANQEISLEQQVQGFRDRMSAVTERLSNPPVKQASEVEETSKGEEAITTSELIESLERGIDLLEGKTSDQLTPEQHHNLEEMENLLWKVEDSLGLSHPLPEHETKEPEHAEETKVREEEFKEPTEKESNLEVKADDVNTPPPNLPPAGFRYSWDPKNNTWILVQITGAPGGGY